MDDYKQAAAKHFNVKPEQLLVCRVANNNLVVVIDNGIKGCPKYIVPLIDLVVLPGLEIESSILSGDDAINATTSAIRLAKESGIDILAIIGTGKDGKITRDDVRAAIKGA